MNTIPKLFLDPTWAGIMSMTRGEQIELLMFGVVGILWIAGMVYGGYRMLSRRGRREEI